MEKYFDKNAETFICRCGCRTVPEITDFCNCCGDHVCSLCMADGETFPDGTEIIVCGACHRETAEMEKNIRENLPLEILDVYSRSDRRVDKFGDINLDFIKKGHPTVTVTIHRQNH